MAGNTDFGLEVWSVVLWSDERRVLVEPSVTTDVEAEKEQIS